MSLHPLLPLLAVLVAAPVIAAKGYHLWYDENGEAVYSQFLPPAGQASEVIKPPPPPAESPEVARDRLQKRLQQFEDNREDEQLAQEKSTAAAGEAQLARQRCEAARKNLDLLNGPPRQLFQTADGVRRLTDEERQGQRAEMQKIIASDCR